MAICCTDVIITNDFRFNNCRKFSLKPQQFALVYLNLHNSPMRQHNTLGAFFKFSLAVALILFDVLTLINIVKRRCSETSWKKKLQRSNYNSRNYSNPLLTQAIFSEWLFFSLQILCDSIL